MESVGSQPSKPVIQAATCVGTQSTTSVVQTTHSNAQSANSSTQLVNSGTPAMPQLLVKQLATYFQQHQLAMGRNQGNAGNDDNLSAASGPTHTNTVQMIPVATPTTSVTSVTSVPITTTTSLPIVTSAVPALASPTSPASFIRIVIPVRIRDKIAKDEYINFASLLSKSIFSTNNPLSQQSVKF